jgi:hypothetical protein
MAQVAFEQLTIMLYEDDILAFNREFNIRPVHYDNILGDADQRGLDLGDWVTTYSIQLYGEVKQHLYAVMRLRDSNNVERIIDDRTPTEFTI